MASRKDHVITEAGKLRISQAQRARWSRWRLERLESVYRVYWDETLYCLREYCGEVQTQLALGASLSDAGLSPPETSSEIHQLLYATSDALAIVSGTLMRPLVESVFPHKYSFTGDPSFWVGQPSAFRDLNPVLSNFWPSFRKRGKTQAFLGLYPDETIAKLGKTSRNMLGSFIESHGWKVAFIPCSALVPSETEGLTQVLRVLEVANDALWIPQDSA